MKSSSFRGTTALLCVLIWHAGWHRPDCRAQEQNPEVGPDYYSLAIMSVLSCAAETSKVSDMRQRIKLLINAAKILPPSEQDDAIRMLEAAVRYLKDWRSENQANSSSLQHVTTTLQNELLMVYATLDTDRTTVLHKQFQEQSQLTKNGQNSRNDGNWYAQFSQRRAMADQTTTIARSFIATNPNRALGLVAESLQGGTVSLVLFDVVENGIQRGNREFLDRLETVMGQALRTNVTLDPFSLAGISAIVATDANMPLAPRSELIGFLMRSLQAFSTHVKAREIDTGYISHVFTTLSLNVRPIISQYAPEQLLALDLILNQVALLVPEQTRSRLQAFEAEKFSDPADRLNDIIKDANPQRRDLRLVRFVSELLRSESETFQRHLDLVRDAVTHFNDPDAKSAFSDLLAITRVNGLLKRKKFIEAQRHAETISAEETRVWALLALSTDAAKTDPVLGFELISNALKVLDKVSASPHKVELALRAAAVLAKEDSGRSFETLLAASRYANSSANNVDPPTKPPVAFGLDAAIGETHTKLGVFPESLADLRIEPAISVLGTVDWFRAIGIADGFREPALRLSLKLELARAVIAQGPKRTKQ